MLKLMIYYKKFILEIVVFGTGFVIMILELDGSRILAPYLGTSLNVWTSLIGVILASLSLGYFLGGKLADKFPSLKILSFDLLIASIFVMLLGIFKDDILRSFASKIYHPDYFSVIACLIIFTVPNILLGMVTPFATSLKIQKIEEKGAKIGSLYAISTIGSIVGTFLAGFYLIPSLGNTKVIYLCSVILILLALISSFSDYKKIKIIVLFAAVITFISSYYSNKNNNKIEIETRYYRAQVITQNQSDRSIRYLKTDLDTFQSGMYLDSSDLLFEYTKYYHLIGYFNSDFKNVLMIGGGAYSFPKSFIKTYPNAQIDVVEIDPGITKIAQDYFNLKENPRLKITHQDGRVYLNSNNQKYDAILIDAFRTISPPFDLTTIEAANEISRSLSEQGIVIVNIVSSLEGQKSDFFQAEYNTFSRVFKKVYIFGVDSISNTEDTQNIMLVGLKRDFNIDLNNFDKNYTMYLGHLILPNINSKTILTDDKAPVENMVLKIL